MSRIVLDCSNLLSQNQANSSKCKKDVALYLHLFFDIMRAIKIIKPKQSADEAVTESKKAVEPSTRNIANTVKTWIDETQQRQRNQPRSLPAIS